MATLTLTLMFTFNIYLNSFLLFSEGRVCSQRTPNGHPAEGRAGQTSIKTS